MLAFESEVGHDLTLHVEYHHADGSFFIIGSEGDLSFGGIGINFSGESLYGLFRMYAGKDFLVVAVGDDFARNAQYRIVGSGTFGAGNAIMTIWVVGMAEVEIVRVELVGQLNTLTRENIEAIVPHHGDAARAPSTAVVGPSAVLWLAACGVGTAGAP